MLMFLFCFHFKNNLYYLVVVLSGFFFGNRTNWFSCLHFVVLFPSLVVLCLMFAFFVLIPVPKKVQQKNGHGKNTNKCRKEGHTNSVSAVVFTLIWGVGLKRYVCWKRYKIVVSPYFEEMAQKSQKGWVKTWSKVESNLVQVCCAT